MTAHTQPFLKQHGLLLTDNELRELFRMHTRAILKELPEFNGGLVDVPVTQLTKHIEPHLKRLCELFEQMKTREPQQEP